MEENILNEITNFCSNECGNTQNCAEEDCVLYRIEKIVVQGGINGSLERH